MGRGLRLALLPLAVLVIAGGGVGLALAWNLRQNETNVAQQRVPVDDGLSPESSTATTPTLGPVIVAPDPDYLDELARSGISTSGWKTDFSRHTVPYAEIISGGVPRDGIPPIDSPSFSTIGAADSWLADREPVITLEINGDARAYPLQIMTWHEIVNDTVGSEPVVVTFCPLCNSAIAFDRRMGDVVYDFGVSGKLRNSDLIMWDRQTESWWQQFTGEAIVGDLAGIRLDMLPAVIISWGDFKSVYPEGQVLARDTGSSRPYGRNPYAGYDDVDNTPFLFRGDPDRRLLPMERVVAVNMDDTPVAFPFSVLERDKTINYQHGNRNLVVFFKPGTVSALDQSSIKDSRDVGATGVFVPRVNDRDLTFRAEGNTFIDNETGSVWNILGQSVSGPLSGERLTPVVHGSHFWFAWGAFNPETIVYQGTG
jgi:hypothetical protein